ncbi:MAG: pyridoxamine 5'-phosphate oxidase [Actinomycetales bacterium]
MTHPSPPSPPSREGTRRLADLRVHYQAGALQEADLAPDPLGSFLAWFAEAEDVGIPEPNAMVLATADENGQPSARTVLLKQADARGFAFYTTLGSRKGRELQGNPQAAIVFPWIALQRQVCVVGSARLIDRAEVDEYFASRPRESQLGAWSSRQSEVIEDRSVLQQRYQQVDERFASGAVQVPEFWGGWLLVPQTVEFWQGRPSRLHDRLRFRRIDPEAMMDDPTGWVLERLSP